MDNDFYRVVLKNRSVFFGHVIKEEEDTVTFKLTNGKIRKIKKKHMVGKY